MKTAGRILFILLGMFAGMKCEAQQTYSIIPKKTGKVNQTVVSTLPQHLKALAALYSAMGGTDCRELKCVLTTALGLGSQGSEDYKKLLLKYFPDDKAAALVLGQDCYLPPSSSSSFSNFRSLGFSVYGDSVRVNYVLAVYDHGNTKLINGPDIYIYKNQVFKNSKRVLYAWTNK